MTSNGTHNLAVLGDQPVPYSQEAEEALLGAVMINPELFRPISVWLKPGDFFFVKHSYIWETFWELSSRNNPIDYITVMQTLKEAGRLDEIGGMVYLTYLANGIGTSIHGETYAHAVLRSSLRRKALQMVDILRGLALDENLPIEELVEGAGKLNDGLNKALALASTESLTIGLADTIHDTLLQVRERIDMAQANPNYTLGVCTGFTKLDQFLDGLQPGIHTFAASTGMGKTSMMLTVAMNAARHGICRTETRPAQILFFSGEMSQEHLNYRLMSMISGWPEKVIKRGLLDMEQYRRLIKKLEIVTEMPIWFRQVARLNTQHLFNLASEMKRKRSMLEHKVSRKAGQPALPGLDLVILDGLLQLKPGTSNDKLRYDIGAVLDDLEAISLELNLPILVTHQLSRARTGRDNKRPVLTDLAEASFIEQKSRNVYFLYRDSYDAKYQNRESEEPEDKCELIVAKNSWGPEGKVYLRWLREHTSYVEWQDQSHIERGHYEH